MRDIGVLDDGGLEAKGTRVWRGWHQLQEASSLIPLSERSASTPSALSRVGVQADSRPRACHDVVTCIVAHDRNFNFDYHDSPLSASSSLSIAFPTTIYTIYAPAHPDIGIVRSHRHRAELHSVITLQVAT